MANLHEAIRALNPSVVTISNLDATDKNGAMVQYDLAAAQAKLKELEAQELAKEQAQAQAKQSALDKLSKLGLTQDEINALIG